MVGLSGTGKSTIAPILARRRGLEVSDLDRLVERTAGRSVADLFADPGEAAFRDLESAVLERVLAGADATVIATGGGVVLRPENRRRLAARATVVWLRADPDQLLERLGPGAPERPLLSAGPAMALRNMAHERDPLYREVADLTVDVGSRSAAAMAEHLDREMSA